MAVELMEELNPLTEDPNDHQREDSLERWNLEIRFYQNSAQLDP